LSPDATAFRTLRIAVRTLERKVTLWARRLIA
jgi:hypothetical protein